MGKKISWNFFHTKPNTTTSNWKIERLGRKSKRFRIRCPWLHPQKGSTARYSGCAIIATTNLISAKIALPAKWSPNLEAEERVGDRQTGSRAMKQSSISKQIRIWYRNSQKKRGNHHQALDAAASSRAPPFARSSVVVSTLLRVWLVCYLNFSMPKFWQATI